jgi:Glutathione S-transferase, N-terminal domain
MSAPIELHYWPTPNGWKISIALEEMGLPYTLVPVNIGAGAQFKPEFLARGCVKTAKHETIPLVRGGWHVAFSAWR